MAGPLTGRNVIAFVVIVDVERAKAFYRDILGLRLVSEEPPYAVVFEANGIMLRLVMGPDNRYLLPGSALLGASFLLIADAVSRVIVAPAELPIGIVTAAVGGPFFLWILLRKRGVVDL